VKEHAMSDVPTNAVPDLPAHGWRTARRCGPNGGNCVAVNLAASGVVGIRDTKPADSPVLVVGPATWRTFLDAAIRGDI
jgi:hypothetical protein